MMMIEVKNITKAYDENVIFQNYNLKIKKGSMNCDCWKKWEW